jgi:dienelactone hydrolase
MAGTHLTIAATNSGTFDSYIALPVSEKGAGVVIVSTISGVDSDMTYYADALAAEGFVASAPDMFWRDADAGPLPWTDDGRKRAFARNDRYDFELATYKENVKEYALRIPYVSAAGLRSMVDFRGEMAAEVKKLALERMYDNSLLQEIQKESPK